jgi:type II secretory pathway pseudopilin PulG
MIKKQAFSLIEVVIAVLIASGACLFLLNFESKVLLRSQHSLEKLEIEQMRQQAYVRLFENLYTNHISWKTVTEGKEVLLDLESPTKKEWKAKWLFKVLLMPELIDPPIAQVEATLCLLHGSKSYEDPIQFKLFLKQELGGNVPS